MQAIQIGVFTGIFGFSSSFVGVLWAGLIDFRLGGRIATGDLSPPWNEIAVNAASVLVGGQLAA